MPISEPTLNMPYAPNTPYTFDMLSVLLVSRAHCFTLEFWVWNNCCLSQISILQKLCHFIFAKDFSGTCLKFCLLQKLQVLVNSRLSHIFIVAEKSVNYFCYQGFRDLFETPSASQIASVSEDWTQ